MGDYGQQPPQVVNVGVDYARATERVNLPAIFMMIIAGISAAFAIFGLLWGLLGTGMASLMPPGSEVDERVRLLFSGVMGILLPLAVIAADAFVVFGALKMKSLQSHTLSVVAAVVNGLPCCASGGCCLGLGLGVSIWALVVLFDNSVKAAFRS